MPIAGLKEPVNFFVLGDTHFNLHDERDAAYADNYARMARVSAPKDVLAKTLKRARDAKVDMFCTVFIGNASTRVMGDKLVTPRGYRDV